MTVSDSSFSTAASSSPDHQIVDSSQVNADQPLWGAEIADCFNVSDWVSTAVVGPSASSQGKPTSLSHDQSPSIPAYLKEVKGLRVGRSESPQLIDNRRSSHIYEAIDKLPILAVDELVDFPDTLSSRLQHEFEFIESVYEYQKSKSYFCELIQWSENCLASISIEDRCRSVDAQWLLDMQRMAVQSLFTPDDSDDCAQKLNVIENSSAPLMHLHPGDEGVNYWEEFLYGGNSSVIIWLKQDNCLQSLGEYCRSDFSLLIDRYTYEYDGKHDRLSRYTKMIDGQVCVVNSKSQLWEPMSSGAAHIYVLTADHQLVIARDLDKPNFYHHSYLQHGLPVICAGKMFITEGKIVAINKDSGHYRPMQKNFEIAVKILKSERVIDDACVFLTSSKLFFEFLKSPDDFAGEEQEAMPKLFPPLDQRVADCYENYLPEPSLTPSEWHINANRYLREFISHQNVTVIKG